MRPRLLRWTELFCCLGKIHKNKIANRLSQQKFFIAYRQSNTHTRGQWNLSKLVGFEYVQRSYAEEIEYPKLIFLFVSVLTFRREDGYSVFNCEFSFHHFVLFVPHTHAAANDSMPKFSVSVHACACVCVWPSNV